MAYGSNLNLGQMKYRCPKARQLGSFYLPNYQLVFRGVADIEPTKDSDSLLPIGIWQITEECEATLDIYEGVKRELYRKDYFTSILVGYSNFGLDTSHLFDALGWSHYEDQAYYQFGDQLQEA